MTELSPPAERRVRLTRESVLAAALRLVDSGGAVAAFVSDPATTTKQLAYAPTAVTGFGIGFVIDRPNNAGEQTELKLTPRLLAKLLSQSYTASNNGKAHPGMATNPVSINFDPEFTELNPGLDEVMREAGATLLSLSEGADSMRAITAYIAADADATAFLDELVQRGLVRVTSGRS